MVKNKMKQQKEVKLNNKEIREILILQNKLNFIIGIVFAIESLAIFIIGLMVITK